MTIVPAEARLRRAKALFAYWDNNQLVFENYRTGVAVAAAPLAAEVLQHFERWSSPAQFYRRMPEYTRSSLDTSLRGLIKAGLLLRKGSAEAREDEKLAAEWSSWLPHAGIFHFATKDAPYIASDAQVARLLRRYLKGSPQPRFFKRPGKSFRQLTKPSAASGEFLDTLLGRRTHRKFSTEALSLDSLSQLLHYTWGVTGYLSAGPLGKLPLKTSPSAGARHAIEVYVLALRVEGLARGLYHYAPDRHRLEKLKSAPGGSWASEYCADQAWVRNAAVLFIMTAVWERSMWKYRFPRAYRTILLDAGHICQTFCLVATHLRLAPFCTAALRDSLIEKDLGIDGLSESVLYVAGAGVPHRTNG